MKKKIIILISLGCFSITAQSLFIRDYLHCLEENELTLGIFYLFWFLWIIPGTLTGRYLRNWSRFLPITSLIYIPAWLWGHFLIRNARYLADIPVYEIFNLDKIFLFSVIAPAGISFCTGFLFNQSNLWWENDKKETNEINPPNTVRSIYAYEALGAVLGGLITSISIYLGFSHWIPLSLAIWLLLTSLILFLNYRFAKQALPIILLPIFIGTGILLDRWENKTFWERLIENGDYQGKIITQQGEYLYGQKENQLILLRNLKPALSFPNPEYGLRLLATFLSQKNDAKSMLLIGEPFIYTFPYLLKISEVQNITWIPFDFDLSAKIFKLLPENELSNRDKLITPRVEPRSFLQNSDQKFDMILVYTGNPLTITANRYLTDTFFNLIKEHLLDKGIAGIRISGGENFLGGEIAALGASTFFTFQKTFGITAIKPGEETWLFGSATYPLSEHVPTLERRLSAFTQPITELKPTIVRDLYPPDRIAFQKDRYDEVKKITSEKYLISTDDNYLGFLYSILFYLWKQGYSDILNKTAVIKRILIFLSVISPLIFIIARGIYKQKSIRKGTQKNFLTTPDICFAIFLTGMVGMGISLLLLILFQYNYGSLSTFVGLFSSMFMLGLSISPLLFNNLNKNKQNKISILLLFLLPLVSICYTFALFNLLKISFYAFLAIFFLWGFTLGFILSWFLEIPKKETDTAKLAVYLEGYDNAGAGLGAFIFPMLLLPFLGLQNSAIIIIFYLLLTLLFVPLLTKIPVHKFALWGRQIRYALFPLLLLCFGTTEIYYRSTIPLPKDRFTEIAQELAQGSIITPETKISNDGKQIRYYVVHDKNENGEEKISYIFSTASLFKVIGYAGEIDMAVKVSSEGNIEDLKVIQSNETPDYLALVENYFFLYKGKNIYQPDTFAEIDTVSGATTTADAIKRAVQFAGKEFAKIIQGTESSAGDIQEFTNQTQKSKNSIYIFLIFILGAIIMRFYHNDFLRTLWLIAVVLILGFWLNIQYGTYSVIQLFSIDKLSITFSISLILAIGIPLLVLINGNIYCGYLCPVGALSELISKIEYINKRLVPTRQAWYTSRQFKYLILFLFLLIYFITRELKLVSIDPLLTFFNLDFTNLATIFGICVLLASLLYKRFWCRVLCPTGAFLSLIQSLRLFSFFWQRTLPARCDLGISRPEEIDCIQCNRCYKHEKK